MKAYIVEFIKKAKNPKDIKFRSQLYILLICLALSIFIWLLIKLSQDTQTIVSYNLKLSNPPEAKILQQDTKKIELSVRSKGTNLFSLKYMTVRPSLKINLTEFKYRKKLNTNKYYILSQQLRQKIITRLKPGEELIGIYPDSIYFYLSQMTKKDLIVMPQLELNFEKQHLLYDSISIDPEMITIKGPGEKIDTIQQIRTEKKVLNEINSSEEFAVQIIKPIIADDISYSSSIINIKLSVEKYTEVSTKVTISDRYLNERYSIRTFPEEVEILYMVALKDFKKVNKEMFELSADFDAAISKEENRVKVKLVKHPPYVKILKIEPSTVDYIILK